MARPGRGGISEKQVYCQQMGWGERRASCVWRIEKRERFLIMRVPADLKMEPRGRNQRGTVLSSAQNVASGYLSLQRRGVAMTGLVVIHHHLCLCAAVLPVLVVVVCGRSDMC